MATPKNTIKAKNDTIEATQQYTETMSDIQPSTINKLRRNKNFMVWLLIALIIAIILLYQFGGLPKRSKQILLWTGIIAATALGLEVFDYDLDLETLWKTGDIQQSRVQNVKWVKLIGDCVIKDAADDLDCANFTTQSEAQAVYQKCVDRIKAYNADKSADDIMRLDIYGLDGNKNGIVCEALPN